MGPSTSSYWDSPWVTHRIRPIRPGNPGVCLSSVITPVPSSRSSPTSPIALSQTSQHQPLSPKTPQAKAYQLLCAPPPKSSMFFAGPSQSQKQVQATLRDLENILGQKDITRVKMLEILDVLAALAAHSKETFVVPCTMTAEALAANARHLAKHNAKSALIVTLCIEALQPRYRIAKKSAQQMHRLLAQHQTQPQSLATWDVGVCESIWPFSDRRFVVGIKILLAQNHSNAHRISARCQQACAEDLDVLSTQAHTLSFSHPAYTFIFTALAAATAGVPQQRQDLPSRIVTQRILTERKAPSIEVCQSLVWSQQNLDALFDCTHRPNSEGIERIFATLPEQQKQYVLKQHVWPSISQSSIQPYQGQTPSLPLMRVIWQDLNKAQRIQVVQNLQYAHPYTAAIAEAALRSCKPYLLDVLKNIRHAANTSQTLHPQLWASLIYHTLERSGAAEHLACTPWLPIFNTHADRIDEAASIVQDVLAYCDPAQKRQLRLQLLTMLDAGSLHRVWLQALRPSDLSLGTQTEHSDHRQLRGYLWSKMQEDSSWQASIDEMACIARWIGTRNIPAWDRCLKEGRVPYNPFANGNRGGYVSPPQALPKQTRSIRDFLGLSPKANSYPVLNPQTQKIDWRPPLKPGEHIAFDPIHNRWRSYWPAPNAMQAATQGPRQTTLSMRLHPSGQWSVYPPTKQHDAPPPAYALKLDAGASHVLYSQTIQRLNLPISQGPFSSLIATYTGLLPLAAEPERSDSEP